MATVPRDPRRFGGLRLLADPYRFASQGCARTGSDVFETRVMFRRAVFARGAEAARVFYVPDRFTRRGAIPPTAHLLLQDRGSAATLDGEAHRHRKRMLLSLMTPARVRALGDAMADAWGDAVGRWEGRGEVVLAREVPEVLCRAVCRWAGVPLAEPEATERTREFVAMYEGAGAISARRWPSSRS
jgi:fatty-acid peroxygenase